MSFLASTVVCALSLCSAQIPDAADDVIEVMTVDPDGVPVGDIPVALIVPDDREHEESWNTIAVTDAVTGLARLSSPELTAWRRRSAEERAADPRQVQVQALVPLVRDALHAVPDDSTEIVRIGVVHVGFVDCSFRSADGARISARGFEIRFESGKTYDDLDAMTLAQRDGATFVPVPASVRESIRMCARLGDRRSRFRDVAAAPHSHSVADFRLLDDLRVTGTLAGLDRMDWNTALVYAIPTEGAHIETCIEFLDDSTPLLAESRDRLQWVRDEGKGSRDFTRCTSVRQTSSLLYRVDALTRVTSCAKDGAFELKIERGSKDDEPRCILLFVHQPAGRCWFAKATIDPAILQDASEIELGTVVAQKDGHTICGRVVDDQGAPVADAALTWSAPGDAGYFTPHRTTTDADGRFRIALRKSQSIELSKTGFETLAVTLAPIQADPTLVLSH